MAGVQPTTPAAPITVVKSKRKAIVLTKGQTKPPAKKVGKRVAVLIADFTDPDTAQRHFQRLLNPAVPLAV